MATRIKNQKKGFSHILLISLTILACASFIGIAVLGAITMFFPNVTSDVEFSFNLDIPRDIWDTTIDYYVGDTIVFNAILVAETARKNVTLRHQGTSPFDMTYSQTSNNFGSSTSTADNSAYSTKTKMQSYDSIDSQNRRFYIERIEVDASIAGVYTYSMTPKFSYKNKIYTLASQKVVFNIKEQREEAECLALSFEYRDNVSTVDPFTVSFFDFKLTNISNDTLEYYNLLSSHSYNAAFITKNWTKTVKELSGFGSALPINILNNQDNLIFTTLDADESTALSAMLTTSLKAPFPLAELEHNDEVTVRVWTEVLVNGRMEKIYAPDITITL